MSLCTMCCVVYCTVGDHDATARPQSLKASNLSAAWPSVIFSSHNHPVAADRTAEGEGEGEELEEEEGEREGEVEGEEVTLALCISVSHALLQHSNMNGHVHV